MPKLRFQKTFAQFQSMPSWPYIIKVIWLFSTNDFFLIKKVHIWVRNEINSKKVKISENSTFTPFVFRSCLPFFPFFWFDLFSFFLFHLSLFWLILYSIFNFFSYVFEHIFNVDVVFCAYFVKLKSLLFGQILTLFKGDFTMLIT